MSTVVRDEAVGGALLASLASLRPGTTGEVIESLLDEADGALLGAMGLSVRCRVRLCRAGEPCIVAVDCGCGSECRIGLSRPLAERIMVRVTSDRATPG